MARENYVWNHRLDNTGFDLQLTLSISQDIGKNTFKERRGLYPRREQKYRTNDEKRIQKQMK